MSRNITGVLSDLARVYDALDVSDGLTVPELMRRVGLARSTAYRYLIYLEAFLGPGSVQEREGRYRLAEDAPMLIRVDRQEKLALTIAHKLLDQIGMPYGDVIERLFWRLAGGERDSAREERSLIRAQVDSTLAFSEPVLCRRPEDLGLVSRLYDCCTATPRRAIRFRYDSATRPEKKDRQVVPLALIFSNAWYLVALDPQQKPATRVYAMDRITELRLDAFGPEYQEPFDVSSYVASAWRLIVGDGEPKRVVLRMPARLAKMSKHPSQTLEGALAEDGQVAFYVSSPEEMVPFIVSHAHEVDVIEPAELKEAVVSRLQIALGRALQA